MEDTPILGCLRSLCGTMRQAAPLRSRTAVHRPSFLKVMLVAAQLRLKNFMWMGPPSGSAHKSTSSLWVVTYAPSTANMSKFSMKKVRTRIPNAHITCTPPRLSHLSYCPVCPDVPKLPVGVAESLAESALRLLRHLNGDFTPTGGTPLLEVITDTLLVVAADAVAAAATTSAGVNDRYRLLAWVVADARGATIAMEKALALNVGKRLDRQAQKVRRALDTVAATAVAARVAAAGDAQLLAAIDLTEQTALEAARAEVYIGFVELNGLLAPSGPPILAPPTASTRLELDAAVASAHDEYASYDHMSMHPRIDPTAHMGGPVLPRTLRGYLGERGCDELKESCAGDMLNLADMVGYRIPRLVSHLADRLSSKKHMHELEFNSWKSDHEWDIEMLRCEVLELQKREGKARDECMEMQEEKHTLSEKVRKLEEELGQEKAANAALHAVVVDMYAIRNKS